MVKIVIKRNNSNSGRIRLKQLSDRLSIADKQSLIDYINNVFDVLKRNMINAISNTSR